MPIGHVVLKIYVPCKKFYVPSQYLNKSCKADKKMSACPDWKITYPVGHVTTKVYVPWDKIYMPRAYLNVEPRRSCQTGNNLWELYWFWLLRHANRLQDLQLWYFSKIFADLRACMSATHIRGLTIISGQRAALNPFKEDAVFTTGLAAPVMTDPWGEAVDVNVQLRPDIPTGTRRNNDIMTSKWRCDILTS